MKKRILAMLLALVMVVSLLPMTVLAAEETGCPGADVDHNLSNCPNVDPENPIEIVAATGCTWGYNVYKCPECNTIFYDEFVKPAYEHTYEEVEAKVEPTCFKAGNEAIFECSVCGDRKGGEPIEQLEHEFTLRVTPEEGACNEIYKCVYCETTQTIENGHNWSDTPDRITPPTGCEYGEAIYVCLTPGCGAEKAVDVMPTGDHDPKDVAEVPATCTENGVMAHQICKNCDALFLNGEKVEAEDLVIPAAHKPEPKETALTVCKTQVDVVCSACGEVLSTEVVADHGNLITIGKSEATCTTWGHTLEACETCGELLTTNSQAPLGHVGYADGDNKKYVAPTCDEDGSKTWTCTRVDEEGNVCGELCSEVVPNLGGHNIVAIEVPATCCTYGYTVYFCANPKCSKSECEEDGKSFTWRSTISLDADNDGVKETYYFGADILRICGEKVYNKTSNKNVYYHKIEVDVEGGFNENLHTEDPAKSVYINAPTCTEPGDKLWYCLGCDYYEVAAVPALGHDYDADNDGVDEFDVTDPTCVEVGFSTYTCVVCGHYEFRDYEDMLGHDWISEEYTVDSTCSVQGGIYRDCDRCGTVCLDRLPLVEYVLGSYYESYEEMAAIHKNHGEPETFRQGDCTTIGLDKYFCDDCDTYVLVVTDNTGTGHVEPDWDAEEIMVKAPNGATGFFPGPVAEGEAVYGGFIMNGFVTIRGKAPTCTEAGFTSEYVCLRCLEIVESVEVPATGHKLTNTEAKAPTCTEAGNIAYSYCEDCDKYFDADGVEVAEDALTLEKLGHNFEIVDQRAVSCTEYGYIHYECTNCHDVDVEYIDNYVAAPDHSPLGERKEATCTEDGYERLSCWVCGEVLVNEVFPATGHTDAEGKTFTATCPSILEDTECVVCGLIEVEHNIVTKNVAATCVDYAYTIHYCTTCEWNEIEEDTIAGLGEHNVEWVVVEEATFHSEGLMKGSCTVCDYEDTKAIPAVQGIGLNMTVDNAVYAGAAICDSSLIKVTIKVDANDVDAWGYNFTVNFDAAVLEFVSADFSNSVFNVNTTTTSAENANGFVKVTANCANTEAGRTQNVNINSEMILVDLYFRVNHEGEGLTTLTIDTARFIDKDAAEASEIVMGDTVEVEIDEYLDFNNDGEFDIVDCQAAYKILIGEELFVGLDEEGNEIYELVVYDATLDVDKDGEITAVDVQMLYNLLVGNNDYEDMTACGVEVEDEE